MKEAFLHQRNKAVDKRFDKYISSVKEFNSPQTRGNNGHRGKCILCQEIAWCISPLALSQFECLHSTSQETKYAKRQNTPKYRYSYYWRTQSWEKTGLAYFPTLPPKEHERTDITRVLWNFVYWETMQGILPRLWQMARQFLCFS